MIVRSISLYFSVLLYLSLCFSVLLHLPLFFYFSICVCVCLCNPPLLYPSLSITMRKCRCRITQGPLFPSPSAMFIRAHRCCFRGCKAYERKVHVFLSSPTRTWTMLPCCWTLQWEKTGARFLTLSCLPGPNRLSLPQMQPTAPFF